MSMLKNVQVNIFIITQGSFDESADEAFSRKGPLRSFWSNENNIDVRKIYKIINFN